MDKKNSFSLEAAARIDDDQPRPRVCTRALARVLAFVRLGEQKSRARRRTHARKHTQRARALNPGEPTTARARRTLVLPRFRSLVVVVVIVVARILRFVVVVVVIVVDVW